ncbi:protein of unknown function [Muriicola jejuensis]|uniref:DUF4834 family protein n=1 Tax=Muriicola jejuensis TaxID=504488 RepID=A0A6P0UJB6_9FLAO|nr:DUF4834 family protein [Muriicola jejuensis]NER11163.1 DUF4834 family protein [Muriicola jejuensis]SMP24110.1 protein of unknown function [Muriicola jejuensis]
MGFLKTLLIILGVYFLLRILGRLFAPWLFRYAVKKTGEQFRHAYEQARENGEARFTGSDGEIRGPEKKQKPNSPDKVGEYIDFEEID